jgi:glycosyltransferase involved in cell wall biosynthesis
MIEIAKAVKNKTKNIKFHLAGEGPERSKLQALIQQYNLNETFVLMGHLEDMLPFYRSLDLYLNTSVHEGIPMSLDYAAAEFAEDARQRVRRRTLVLQVLDNKADSVKSATPCGLKC